MPREERSRSGCICPLAEPCTPPLIILRNRMKLRKIERQCPRSRPRCPFMLGVELPDHHRITPTVPRSKLSTQPEATACLGSIGLTGTVQYGGTIR